MASLTIRNLDDQLKAGLRLRAARHGRSMEEEVRQILRQVLVVEDSTESLAKRIHHRFKRFRVNELMIPARRVTRRPPG